MKSTPMGASSGEDKYLNSLLSQDDLVLSDFEPDSVHVAVFSPQRQRQFRMLGPLGLIGLTFFVSCGGPIGSEPLMSTGGPVVGLLGMVAYVVVCVLPFAFVIAELTSTFPENGGSTVWILTAFGPFWGFQVGYWTWVAAVINNAIYPSLMYTIIKHAYGLEMSGIAEYFAKVSVAVLLSVPSLLSVRFVAGAAFVLVVVISAIFLLFSTWAFADGNHAWHRLLDVRSSDMDPKGRDSGIQWGLLVNSLFWNFDGLYDASIIAGEVLEPAKTYPRVLGINIAITVAIYLMPLVSAVTGTTSSMPWIDFDEDSFPKIAKNIGGSVPENIVLVSSILSLVGLFTSSIIFQSFQVLGMAHLRLLPAAFRTRHKTHQTPQYAVCLSIVTTMLLMAFDYESVLSMTNAFSAAVQVMIVLAMLQLRRKYPYLMRPIQVPGPLMLVSAILIPTSAVFLYIFFKTLVEPKLAISLMGLVAPGVIYGLYHHERVRQELEQRARQQQEIVLSRILPPVSRAC